MSDAINKFIDELSKSLTEGSFVKLILGNYKGAEKHLQKITSRVIDTKRGRQVSFQKHYDTRQTVTNTAAVDAVPAVRKFFESGFRSAHLFTTSSDIQLKIGKRNSHLTASKPRLVKPALTTHDREKNRLIDPNAFFLKALGITTDEGRVRAQSQDKWRQINKYVEILRDLFERSALKDRERLKIVDMGSGKGYLTFAAYEYFANIRGLNVEMTGVDAKDELIGLCNDIARSAGYEGLRFVTSNIEAFDPGPIDILIALHACDTATDEALYKGISARAEIIVAAPCCHKEIRRQIKPPAVLQDIFKHGTMLEREAEMITDGLRSMLLERSGYKTKIFEFVPVEHTAKNNMIVAVRNSVRHADSHLLNERIEEVKAMYGIDEQRLENLLA